MKQITVRGVGTDLHNRIKEEATRLGLSINRYLLLVMRQAVGLEDGQSRQNMEFEDLDHLAGTWTTDEYEQFGRLLVSQRIVDTEIWR